MNKKEKFDLVLVLVWPVFATILSFLTRATFFTSVFLFLALPAIYISLRQPVYVKKSLVFSSLASIPMILVVDTIGQQMLSWSFPPSVFGNFSLFGVVSVEVILWSFFNIYFVIIFYEHFLDKHITKKLWHPKMKYLAIIMLALFAVFIILFFNAPSVFNIPYFYLVMGVAFIALPVILQLVVYPHNRTVWPKFLKAAAYFFYLSFIYEITALQLGWWDFPGVEFIGYISIFEIRFPLEELIFWIMLFALGTLAGFEFFDDDEK